MDGKPSAYRKKSNNTWLVLFETNVCNSYSHCCYSPTTDDTGLSEIKPGVGCCQSDWAHIVVECYWITQFDDSNVEIDNLWVKVWM